MAYLMKTEARMDLPRRLQMEFSRVVQAHTDSTGGEVSPKQIVEIFNTEYLAEGVWGLTHAGSSSTNGQFRVRATVNDPSGRDLEIEGEGNGPLSAFVDALGELGARVKVLDYSEHALESGGDAQAVAYVECEIGSGDDAQVLWGVGVDASITSASMKAILSALNRIDRS